MTRTKNIHEEFSRPNSRKINGQSTEKNIRLMGERSAENSIHAGNVGQFRAENGEVRLPDTNKREMPPAHDALAKSGDDARRIGKQMNNSGRDTDYCKGIRRI
jgi:hypothetical protein